MGNFVCLDLIARCCWLSRTQPCGSRTHLQPHQHIYGIYGSRLFALARPTSNLFTAEIVLYPGYASPEMCGERSDTAELDPSHRDQEPLMILCPTGDQKSEKRTVMSSLERANRKLDRIRNWKVALINGAIASGIVLSFNLGFVLWAIQRYELEDGRGTLYTGHCERARRVSIGFHLVINVLSTILLGASNYAMVCYPIASYST